MTSRFVRNPMFEAQLKRADFLQDAMLEVAEDIADNAVAIAPVEEGDYRDGIEAVSEGEGARVNANDWKSGFVEFGTTNNPAWAPLRRGCESAGLRLEGSVTTFVNETDVMPDAESVASKIIRAGTGGRVYSSIPSKPTYPLIVVQRLGGIPRTRRLDAANIQVDVWGTSKVRDPPAGEPSPQVSA